LVVWFVLVTRFTVSVHYGYGSTRYPLRRTHTFWLVQLRSVQNYFGYVYAFCLHVWFCRLHVPTPFPSSFGLPLVVVGSVRFCPFDLVTFTGYTCHTTFAVGYTLVVDGYGYTRWLRICWFPTVTRWFVVDVYVALTVRLYMTRLPRVYTVWLRCRAVCWLPDAVHAIFTHAFGLRLPDVVYATTSGLRSFALFFVCGWFILVGFYTLHPYGLRLFGAVDYVPRSLLYCTRWLYWFTRVAGYGLVGTVAGCCVALVGSLRWLGFSLRAHGSLVVVRLFRLFVLRLPQLVYVYLRTFVTTHFTRLFQFDCSCTVSLYLPVGFDSVLHCGLLRLVYTHLRLVGCTF